MTTGPIVRQNSNQTHLGEADIALSLSQAFGLGSLGYESLNNHFYAGLRPVLAGLKEGILTEKQASLLIELLLANYIETTVNRQIDTLFQGWAERLMEWGSGGDSGRR
jgi:hypothetical protein